jgi:hypothetical protein
MQVSPRQNSREYRSQKSEYRIQNTEFRPELRTSNQPSKPPQIIVATSDWPLLPDSLEMRPLVGTVEPMLLSAHRGSPEGGPAVRALAFKWIRIIFRLWQDHTTYDEERYLRDLQKRHSPLSQKIQPQPL